MTYPPGSPGYPSTQPTTQFSAPTQQISKLPEPAEPGQSKLPVYLAAAVAALGLAVYLSSFGPQFTISNSEFPQLGSASGSTLGMGIAVAASVLAALLAGVSLVPKQKNFGAVVAAIAVLSFLLVIGEVINAPSGATIDWALYLIIAFTLLQAGAAVAWLLLDAGVITVPAPRPKHDQQQQQYNPYGAPGGYYGQQQHPGGQYPQQQGGQQQGGQQRPGYPPQYGQNYPGSPSTGGFQGANPQSGPPTPPTGFPTYGQPQSSGAPGDSGGQGSSPQQSAQPQQSATQQSAPPPS